MRIGSYRINSFNIGYLYCCDQDQCLFKYGDMGVWMLGRVWVADR